MTLVTPPHLTLRVAPPISHYLYCPIFHPMNHCCISSLPHSRHSLTIKCMVCAILQGRTQPINLRGFQAEFTGLYVNVSGFRKIFREYQQGFLAQIRRYTCIVYLLGILRMQQNMFIFTIIVIKVYKSYLHNVLSGPQILPSMVKN